MEGIIQRTKNGHGISVAKCCASCKNKKSNNRTRLCLLGAGTVSPRHYCQQWEMAEGLKNAGKGGGKVKKKTYLSYSLETFFHEGQRLQEAVNMKQPFLRKSIMETREDFEKKFGSIYVNI